MTLKLIIVNALTMIRVIGTIILIPIYQRFGGEAVGLLSLICYLTDSIDGILARKWQVSTFFGALFDGFSDKLFTLINFIVLYMITPYALIPIVFEILIILIQFIKFLLKYNIQSNIIGKVKVWILAICVILTFFAADIKNIGFLSYAFKENIISVQDNLYFWLLFPAILMEVLTFGSYVLEMFKPKKIKVLNKSEKKLSMPKMKYNSTWKNFKYIWLNPKFYKEHKNDSNLADLRKLK